MVAGSIPGQTILAITTRRPTLHPGGTPNRSDRLQFEMGTCVMTGSGAELHIKDMTRMGGNSTYRGYYQQYIVLLAAHTTAPFVRLLAIKFSFF